MSFWKSPPIEPEPLEIFIECPRCGCHLSIQSPGNWVCHGCHYDFRGLQKAERAVDDAWERNR